MRNDTKTTEKIAAEARRISAAHAISRMHVADTCPSIYDSIIDGAL